MTLSLYTYKRKQNSWHFFVLFFSATGFTGAYNPAAAVVEAMLRANFKNASSSSALSPVARKRRSLLAVSTTNPDMSGINNPVTCLKYNDVLMFSVTNDYFPEYDSKNLYNTNPDFDYGAFKDLAEKHKLMNTNASLFTFRFDTPGVYAFKMSSTSDQKMVSTWFSNCWPLVNTFVFWRVVEISRIFWLSKMANFLSKG